MYRSRNFPKSFFLLAMVLVLRQVIRSTSAFSMAANANSIYQFKVKGTDGSDVTLEKYKGKVVVIINVASKCGLATTNYSQLKEIHDKYKSRGFEVAAFPCNQFANQEPGSVEEIRAFIKDKYNFTPDLYMKVDVNGKNEDPLYTFLKQKQGGSLMDLIKWNFTKFLVNKQGHPIQRYAPTTVPNDMISDIEKALAE